jgi:nucleotidyltransferase/DNA polymerase involved in DNA repair
VRADEFILTLRDQKHRRGACLELTLFAGVLLFRQLTGTLRGGLPTATNVAKMIREEIWNELNLTASAGVAPNKFLAKIASDWRKPNGLFVIQPKDIETFLVPLPVGRIPEVGRVTEARLKEFGIGIVGDVLAHDQETLVGYFGRYGERLHQLARGVDHKPGCSESSHVQCVCWVPFLALLGQSPAQI